VDYVEVCDGQTLADLAELQGPVLLAAAVWVGRTRLIDNIYLEVCSHEQDDAEVEDPPGGAHRSEPQLYGGSITIDRDLMDAADILPYEQVQVVNNNNGARFETYCIEGTRGSGVICLNGAAARLGQSPATS
jgi:hypothetical protein